MQLSLSRLISAVFIILPQALVESQQCYYPDGSPSKENDQPCSSYTSDGGVNCCPYQWECLSNGLCQNPALSPPYLGRYTCTDKNWGPGCFSQCTTSNDSGGGNQAVLLCSNGQYCCDANRPDADNPPQPGCCDTQDTFFSLPKGMVIASISDANPPAAQTTAAPPPPVTTTAAPLSSATTTAAPSPPTTTAAPPSPAKTTAAPPPPVTTTVVHTTTSSSPQAQTTTTHPSSPEAVTLTSPSSSPSAVTTISRFSSFVTVTTTTSMHTSIDPSAAGTSTTYDFTSIDPSAPGTSTTYDFTSTTGTSDTSLLGPTSNAITPTQSVSPVPATNAAAATFPLLEVILPVVVGLAFIIGIIVYCCCRRSRRNKRDSGISESSSAGITAYPVNTNTYPAPYSAPQAYNFSSTYSQVPMTEKPDNSAAYAPRRPYTGDPRHRDVPGNSDV